MRSKAPTASAPDAIPPADPVGQPTEWEGEQQEDQTGPHGQQRERRDRQIVASLQHEVDEAVADGGQTEQGGHDAETAEGRPGQ